MVTYLLMESPCLQMQLPILTNPKQKKPQLTQQQQKVHPQLALTPMVAAAQEPQGAQDSGLSFEDLWKNVLEDLNALEDLQAWNYIPGPHKPFTPEPRTVGVGQGILMTRKRWPFREEPWHF